MFNSGKYAEICLLPLTSLRVQFSMTYTEFTDLINCPLRVKELIFLAIVTDVRD